jgi:NRAMP (natural resistance-associated macrophage protein)-like metal ion transporter
MLPQPKTSLRTIFAPLAVFGPGLLVMLADTDAGNVVTAAQAGARWGYRLLPLILLLIPVLYMVQELAVRLGIHSGRGHGELVRERFGAGWAWLSVAGLAAATIGSLVTEFTGVAGIAELYGLPRGFGLVLAAAGLLLIAATGSYRRVERVALAIGAFEAAFLVVALVARPDPHRLAADVLRQPLGDREYRYLAAAVIGAVFNPWMVFYQQSAVAEKGLEPADAGPARLDTAVGAVVTQVLTGAVLVAAAATLAGAGRLDSVGQISRALSPILGPGAGQIVFSLGVLGASLVAAIVSSLGLAWGLGEVAGHRRALEYRPFASRWFSFVYAVAVAGAAALVWLVPDLVRLNIAAQVLNAFLLPLALGPLVALAATALPSDALPGRGYLRLLVGVVATVCAAGLAGGIAGLF